jgi:hypothetical protein
VPGQLAANSLQMAPHCSVSSSSGAPSVALPTKWVTDLACSRCAPSLLHRRVMLK